MAHRTLPVAWLGQGIQIVRPLTGKFSTVDHLKMAGAGDWPVPVAPIHGSIQRPALVRIQGCYTYFDD